MIQKFVMNSFQNRNGTKRIFTLKNQHELLINSRLFLTENAPRDHKTFDEMKNHGECESE